jgi:hypothetical protein
MLFATPDCHKLRMVVAAREHRLYLLAEEQEANESFYSTYRRNAGSHGRV